MDVECVVRGDEVVCEGVLRRSRQPDVSVRAEQRRAPLDDRSEVVGEEVDWFGGLVLEKERHDVLEVGGDAASVQVLLRVESSRVERLGRRPARRRRADTFRLPHHRAFHGANLPRCDFARTRARDRRRRRNQSDHHAARTLRAVGCRLPVAADAHFHGLAGLAAASLGASGERARLSPRPHKWRMRIIRARARPRRCG